MLLLLLVLTAGLRLPAAAALQFGVVTPADLNKAVQQAANNQTAHSQCKQDFMRWMDGLSSAQRWALQIADSWTKAPTGVFYGNKNDLGNFDECVRASSDSGEHTPSSLPVIRGAYLLPILSISSKKQGAAPSGGLSAAGLVLSRLVPLSLSVAFCVPASCDAGLVVAALGSVAEDLLRDEALGDHFAASVSYAPRKLQTEDNAHKPDWPEWAFLAVAVFLILIAVVATVLDNKLDESDSKNVRERWRCLLHFSLSSGVRRLLAPAPASSMRCINGLRVLSTLWIMLGHTNGYYPPVMNSFAVKEMESAWTYMLMQRYSMAVDTFLAIGGLVCCMSFLRAVNKNGFNWFTYAFRRYARTTPATAITILFGATWLRMLATGADTFQGADVISNWFLKYWWTSLVPISNFFGDFSHIVSHTWYMSVDLQLYLVAPVVLVPLWKRPLAGLVFLALVTLAACVTPAIISVAHHYATAGGAGMGDMEALYQYNVQTSYSPYCRAAPYFVGIAAGYFLHQVKHGGLKFKINGLRAAALWVLITAVGLAVVFASRSILLDKSRPYSAVEDFAYQGFAKLSWGTVIVLIIIMCEMEWGGPVNKILSWSAFAPLGKLSFSIYLVHYFFVMVDYFYYAHVAEYFSIYNLMRRLLAAAVMTVPLAGLLHLVVEQPFVRLESELWK